MSDHDPFPVTLREAHTQSLWAEEREQRADARDFRQALAEQPHTTTLSPLQARKAAERITRIGERHNDIELMLLGESIAMKLRELAAVGSDEAVVVEVRGEHGGRS